MFLYYLNLQANRKTYTRNGGLAAVGGGSTYFRRIRSKQFSARNLQESYLISQEIFRACLKVPAVVE